MLESLERLRKYELFDRGIELSAYMPSDKLADEIQAEVDERYMLLPVDADGVPIHVGDEVVCSYGVDEVEGVHPERIFLLHENEWLCVQAQYKKHHKPRTLEEVLGEFSARVLNSGHQWGLDAQGTIAEYADELRKLIGGGAQ